ncbi:MAG: ATP-dependent DNA ligase, partial [Acidimicrobiia bacterium]
MLLADVVAVSDAVSSTSSRSEKIALLAGILGRLTGEEVPIALAYLSGRPAQRRLGAGYATVFGVEVEAGDIPVLRLVDVERAFEEMAAAAGPGSKARRESVLADLLARATPGEQAFLRGLILRNLRQGALEGVMAEAVAEAVGASPQRVRRAAMLEGDLVAV